MESRSTQLRQTYRSLLEEKNNSVLALHYFDLKTIIMLMDIRELTAEMNRFVESQGWYQVNSPRPQTLRNLAISLCLEGAEILEHFQWDNSTENLEGLAEELADVTLYLLQIASIAEIDLEAAIFQKLNRNYQRTWNENNLDQGTG